MFQSPGAIALNIGSISIRWYGILIGIGIVLCYLYVINELKRRSHASKDIDDMAFWVIASGIVGARLYYVLFNLDYFSNHLLEILQIWNGGLAIHGALIGGAIAYFIYIFRNKLSWTFYADIILPGVLLAQAIGRFGNFFNNEAFGSPTDLPWKLFIPFEYRPDSFKDFAYYHPTFLYESLWNLLGFALLVVLTRKIYRESSKTSGFIFFTYLAWYSIGRFFIEGLRMDSLYLGEIRIAQLMSAVLFVIGVGGLVFVYRRRTQ